MKILFALVVAIAFATSFTPPKNMTKIPYLGSVMLIREEGGVQIKTICSRIIMASGDSLANLTFIRFLKKMHDSTGDWIVPNTFAVAPISSKITLDEKDYTK